MSLHEYRQFIASRGVTVSDTGFSPDDLSPLMKAHQVASVDYSLNKGRAALFLDTGLGKSLCELEWARQVCEETGKPVLILTPLAVAGQMIREG